MLIYKLLQKSKVQVQKVAFRAYVSQLTMGVLLALFPAVLVLMTLIGFWFDANQILTQSFETLAVIVPGAVLELIKSNILNVLDGESVAVFSIGFVILLYTIESLPRQVMNIMNSIYDVKETRSFWRRVLMSFLLLAGGLVIGLAIVQLIFITDNLVNLVQQTFGVYIINFKVLFWRWPLAMAVMFLFVYFSYLFIPNLRKTHWRYQFVGALFFVVGWLIMSLFFTLYVSNFADYNKTYGVLGAIIMVLFYLKLNAYLYLLGGVLNSRLVILKEPKG